MPADQDPQSLSDREHQEAAEAVAQLHRDYEAAKDLPPREVRNTGKFTEPIGLTDAGELQPPLTDDEREHNAAVRRRAWMSADEPHGS